MAGKGDMDTILDQALDDLEGVEKQAAVSQTGGGPSEKMNAECDVTEAVTSAAEAQGDDKSEPVDPKEFFKYLMEGDDELAGEHGDAKLEDFMKQLHSSLQGEANNDDSNEDQRGQPGKDVDDDVDATLAHILQQMTTIDQGDPSQSEGNFSGTNFNPDDVMDGMMEQLLSKDLMYEPMKQVADRFPAWLESKKETLSESDFERYTKQFQCFEKLVHQYETEPPDMDLLMELMQEVQEFGQPPQDIVNEIAPGLELDDDGMPKMNPLEALGKGGNGDCVVM